jgi:hypothetical protein
MANKCLLSPHHAACLHIGKPVANKCGIIILLGTKDKQDSTTILYFAVRVDIE